MSLRPGRSLIALALMAAAGGLAVTPPAKPSERDRRTPGDVAERAAKNAAKRARRAARNKS